MQRERILGDIKLRLEKLNIYELRQVARAVGVHRPADGKKSRVINAILEIAQNNSVPEPPSLRGAPPKSQQFDEELVADIKTCRNFYIALAGGIPEEEPTVLKLSDVRQEFEAYDEKGCGGLLDLSEKYAFLRSCNGGTNLTDVFVHDSFISRYSLREGDFVEGRCLRKSADEAYGLSEIFKINGENAAKNDFRRFFYELTPVYPQVNVKTAVDGKDILCRIIDMFAPLALGQRAVISAPGKSGATSLLKSIATGISSNYPQIKVVLLLTNELPEEITDYKRTVKNCEIFYSTFDMPADTHYNVARLCAEHCKRICESGGNAVLLFDGITRFKRAISGCGRNADEEVKRILSCACNAEEGGSVTVMSTLSAESTCSDSDAEFISIANMCIALSSELSLKRIFPAIDFNKCFADRDGQIIGYDCAQTASYLKINYSYEDIIKLFKETEDNSEIIEKFKN